MADLLLAKELFKASSAGDAAAVRAMLAQDRALVGARDALGSTPLHRAAWKGHLEVARALLDHGANPNAQDQNEHYGGTPLHAAAHGNQPALVALLIERGADVGARSLNGRTPLDETVYHKAIGAARVLREHGAVG